jgi:hypothetical protein
MSFTRSSFLVLLFGFTLVALTACDNTPVKIGKGKSTEAEATVNTPPVDPGADPLLGDSSLPVVPTDKGGSTSNIDPDKLKGLGKTKAAFEGPEIPKGTIGGAAAYEVVVPTLPIPKAGEQEPTLKPQILALTYIGGEGDQWIQEVGFTPDGKIYAKSGGGTFTVYYTKEGKKFGVEGDITKPCTGPRGPEQNTRGNKAFRTTCPTTKVKLELGYESFGGMKAQPYLTSSADWKWWGWEAGDMGKGMESSARGNRLYWLQDDRFLAKVFVDGGKSTVQKDPRNLKTDNTALSTAMLRDPAGPGTLYISGNTKTGIPGLATFVKGKALAEAIDPWERLYVGVYTDSKASPDAFKLGGMAGLTVINGNLTNAVFTGTLGADHIYSMAIKDNILVLGGNIGMSIDLDPNVQAKNIPPAKLKVTSPAQSMPGGGEDGFLAIIKLW